MSGENEPLAVEQPARIAVYDNFLSAPRIVEIQPCAIASYIEQIASKTYELAMTAGGDIPYTVIREVSENFIHARFKEPTISIFDHGKTIRFADQGPGIDKKDRAQMPGFTSATSEMKQYIRGVGSGLPIVREYLKFSNGRLVIEDNIREGTVITITVNEGSVEASPVVYQEVTTLRPSNEKAPRKKLNDREASTLILAAELGEIGPTELQKRLDIPTASGYRILTNLEKAGYLVTSGSTHKRCLTEAGIAALSEQE